MEGNWTAYTKEHLRQFISKGMQENGYELKKNVEFGEVILFRMENLQLVYYCGNKEKMQN